MLQHNNGFWLYECNISLIKNDACCAFGSNWNGKQDEDIHVYSHHNSFTKCKSLQMRPICVWIDLNVIIEVVLNSLGKHRGTIKCTVL